MAAPVKNGVKGTPLDQGIVARVAGMVAGGVRGAIQGAGEAWFGPQQPMLPVAPEEVRGRRFDYPIGFNLQYRPRGEQGENAIDFPTLRALAEPAQGGLDLLRLAIETRKDQMESQRWSIRDREGDDGGKRARELEKKLRFPDREHTWSQWQRMLLEDLFVLDAPCVYLRPDPAGGEDLIPEIMDGSLLKRLVRPDGRTPLPPDPAFQQSLHGLPAVDYSLDDLVYLPRNLRSNRIYGMGQVEQVVMTIQIALRRQLFQLEEYTAGSIPDLAFGVPESWTVQQIREFQDYWDSILSGNTAERRRARFIPGGMKPFPLKGSPLKDEYDEWLARIICYCFSLSPQALIKQMNRGTANTAKEAAQEEGLEPLKGWWKDFVDSVLIKAYHEDDLELVFEDEEVVNPVDKANVTSIATGKKGWLTVSEAREEYGRDPLSPEEEAKLNQVPPAPGEFGDGGGDEPASPASLATGAAGKKKPPAAGKEKSTKGGGAAAALLEAARSIQKLASAMRGGGRIQKAAHQELIFKRDPVTGAIVGAVMNGAAGHETVHTDARKE